ncbi:hypothetical protein [Paraburkholderia sediminicola]|uniref:hypothetical protein n=1 Tax=Paraburkholderia sediminicola TaxID=458836 RepID=UPI001581FBF6|nr:hypothetical protein [Paraburkholderia sediminicola]
MELFSFEAFLIWIQAKELAHDAHQTETKYLSANLDVLDASILGDSRSSERADAPDDREVENISKCLAREEAQHRKQGSLVCAIADRSCDCSGAAYWSSAAIGNASVEGAPAFWTW